MVPDVTDVRHPASVRQLRVAIELRRLRESQNRDFEWVARILNCSPGEVQAIEQCRRSIAPDTLMMLLRVGYGSDDDGYNGYFYRLASDGMVRGWTQRFVDPTPRYARMFLALNTYAVRKTMYNPAVVPGILQTRQYMRSLMSFGLRAGNPELAQGIELRVNTQSRLTHVDAPLQVRAVIGEGALRCRVGAADVMRGQYLRLLEVSELDNADIRVLPFAAGECAAFGQPFVMLDFSFAKIPDAIVYLEHQTRTDFLDDGEVTPYADAFTRLSHAALNCEESRDYIQAIHDDCM